MNTSFRKLDEQLRGRSNAVFKLPSGLLLRNIGQLLTLSGPPGPRRRSHLNEVGLIQASSSVLCAGNQVVAAGRERDVLKHPWLKKFGKKVSEWDCQKRVVLPGFVDSHAHLVFEGPRISDFEKRISGSTYRQIAAAGGGIRSSVAAVRSATRSRLAELALLSLNRMLAQGTTTVEAKSGYGLSLAAEIKSLKAIRDASTRWPGTVVSTLLAAHVIPEQYETSRRKYLKIICEEMIPQAAKNKLARFVDVFCEAEAFSVGECELIFAAATRFGLGVRAHIGQFSPSPLQSLMKYKPRSLDHLDFMLKNELPLLAGGSTVATLLPGSNFFLGSHKYPDARKLIGNGAAVALATDYNPGTSPTTSMPFILSLACTHMKMTPAESISAATINGAFALGLEAHKGSIEPGKDADMAIFDLNDYREIPYWFGSNHCFATIANGMIVQQN